MNSLPDLAEHGRFTVLQQFKIEELQSLSQASLLTAQSLAGHGDQWGCWQTPASLSSGTTAARRRTVVFADRLQRFLDKEQPAVIPTGELMREGVLVLSRIALLLRLAPSGGHGYGKSGRLKPISVAGHLYSHWSRIVARAIRRKAGNPSAGGLLRCLTAEDLQEFGSGKATRIEVERLDTFVARGLWADAPPIRDLRQTTSPAQKPITRTVQNQAVPYLPLPDEWLAEIGPRVLWIVQDLGPHLLKLLEALPQELKDANWAVSVGSLGRVVAPYVQECIRQHSWLDHTGKPIAPPFKLTTAHGKKKSDTVEWPPRGWENIITLSVTLQAAHLFITLLASAGRIGEIATLTRQCVTVGRDGKDYLKGFTYKLSGNLFGDARQWPAPEILCQCIGQQARLAAAMDWLPKSLRDGLPETPRFGDALWVSIGVSGKVGESRAINFNQTLGLFARRLDMDTKPGGDNVHAHRFRKTIGRLAGVALWNSPLVLKRLFGHKSIEMTLHYILSEPGIREEADTVLRELRVMHCAEILEDIHKALYDGMPLPGNGGPGAAQLVAAVRHEQDCLNQAGRIWDSSSAYDLAYLLTAQGQGWRLIKENIVCSKAPGEDGLCQKKRSKGEPNTANCQPECGNRVVMARKRRDAELIIDQYLDIARQARDEGQLLVLASVMGNAQEEWADFTDLEQLYRADPEVQELLALCEESDVMAEAA